MFTVMFSIMFSMHCTLYRSIFLHVQIDIWCDGVDRIHLAQVSGQLWAAVNTEMNEDSSLLSSYALSTATW
jgi:hypothetical protein